jgi:hypothetical protein
MGQRSNQPQDRLWGGLCEAKLEQGSALIRDISPWCGKGQRFAAPFFSFTILVHLACFVYFVCLVCFVNLVERSLQNKPNQPTKPDQPSIVEATQP